MPAAYDLATILMMMMIPRNLNKEMGKLASTRAVTPRTQLLWTCCQRQHGLRDRTTRYKRGGEGGGVLIFCSRLSHLIVDHASLSRRSIVSRGGAQTRKRFRQGSLLHRRSLQGAEGQPPAFGRGQRLTRSHNNLCSKLRVVGIEVYVRRYDKYCVAPREGVPAATQSVNADTRHALKYPPPGQDKHRLTKGQPLLHAIPRPLKMIWDPSPSRRWGALCDGLEPENGHRRRQEWTYMYMSRMVDGILAP